MGAGRSAGGTSRQACKRPWDTPPMDVLLSRQVSLARSAVVSPLVFPTPFGAGDFFSRETHCLQVRGQHRNDCPPGSAPVSHLATTSCEAVEP